MCSEVIIKCPTWRHSQPLGYQTVTGRDLIVTIDGSTYVALSVTVDEIPAQTVLVELNDLRRIVQVADALGVG